MCVSVGHGVYDERKILMKMSSNEPLLLNMGQPLLQDTSSAGFALDFSSCFSQEDGPGLDSTALL